MQQPQFISMLSPGVPQSGQIEQARDSSNSSQSSDFKGVFNSINIQAADPEATTNAVQVRNSSPEQLAVAPFLTPEAEIAVGISGNKLPVSDLELDETLPELTIIALPITAEKGAQGGEDTEQLEFPVVEPPPKQILQPLFTLDATAFTGQPLVAEQPLDSSGAISGRGKAEFGQAAGLVQQSMPLLTPESNIGEDGVKASALFEDDVANLKAMLRGEPGVSSASVAKELNSRSGEFVKTTANATKAEYLQLAPLSEPGAESSKPDGRVQHPLLQRLDQLMSLVGSGENKASATESVPAATAHNLSISYGQVAAEAQPSLHGVPLEPKAELNAQQQLQHLLQRPVAHAEGLVARIGVMLSLGSRVAELQLDPPELGHLQVRIQQQGNEYQVHFHAANSQVRDLINEQLPRLKELFAQQGFDLTDSQVGEQGQDNQSGRSKSTVPPTGSDAEPEPSLQNIASLSLRLIDQFA